MGSSPTKKVAKKAAALPAALTNGCGTVQASSGDLSAPGVCDTAALDMGGPTLDLPPSLYQLDPYSSSSALEEITASSVQMGGSETQVTSSSSKAVHAAAQPQNALAAALTSSPGRSMPTSQGRASAGLLLIMLPTNILVFLNTASLICIRILLLQRHKVVLLDVWKVSPSLISSAYHLHDTRQACILPKA